MEHVLILLAFDESILSNVKRCMIVCSMISIICIPPRIANMLTTPNSVLLDLINKKPTLEEIKNWQLTADALKLAQARGVVPKALRYLKLIQECANGLYDAIQDGWQCNCETLYLANIELEAWAEEANKRKEDVYLKFSCLFAQDAERGHSDYWFTADIRPVERNSNGSSPPNTASRLSGSYHNRLRNTLR